VTFASDVEYVLVLDDWLDGMGTDPNRELQRIRDAGAAMGDMSGMDHDANGDGDITAAGWGRR
jgi:FtsP/CotA-like multicopper oxidase with cupredoxin domain